MNFLLLDFVIIPENMNYRNWIELYELAEFFCLRRLVVVCEQQICNHISDETCSDIIEFGLKNRIETLALSCADYIIKSMVNKEDKYQLELAAKTESKDKILEYMYNLSRFDILQVRLERIKLLNDHLKRKDIYSHEEKENYEINYNE